VICSAVLVEKKIEGKDYFLNDATFIGKIDFCQDVMELLLAITEFSRKVLIDW